MRANAEAKKFKWMENIPRLAYAAGYKLPLVSLLLILSSLHGTHVISNQLLYFICCSLRMRHLWFLINMFYLVQFALTNKISLQIFMIESLEYRNIASVAFRLIYLIWNKIMNNTCQHTFSSHRHCYVHNWWTEIRIGSWNHISRKKMSTSSDETCNMYTLKKNIAGNSDNNVVSFKYRSLYAWMSTVTFFQLAIIFLPLTFHFSP